jgi:hypothetical protein
MSDWFANVDPAQASFSERIAMVVLAIPVLLARALEAVRSHFSATNIALFLLPLGAALLVITIFGILLAQWLASALSGRVSRRINSMTVAQIRGLLSGADVNGERATGCEVRPFWSKTTMGSLPPALSTEIAAISDAAAAKAIGTIRGRAAEIAASPDFKQRLAQYLTWDELLHTTYFKSPLFLRLLAYAISKEEGFAATPALARDPSYALLRDWLDDIQRSPAEASPAGRPSPTPAPATQVS